MKRHRSQLVEAVDAAHMDILKADANAMRGQLITLAQGTGARWEDEDVSGLFIADISKADGTDVAGD